MVQPLWELLPTLAIRFLGVRTPQTSRKVAATYNAQFSVVFTQFLVGFE